MNAWLIAGWMAAVAPAPESLPLPRLQPQIAATWTEDHAWAAAKAASDEVAACLAMHRAAGLVLAVMPPAAVGGVELGPQALSDLQGYVTRAVDRRVPTAPAVAWGTTQAVDVLVQVIIEPDDKGGLAARTVITETGSAAVVSNAARSIDPRDGAAFQPPAAAAALARFASRPLRHREVFGSHERDLQTYVAAIGRPRRIEPVEARFSVLHYDGFDVFYVCPGTGPCSAQAVIAEGVRARLADGLAVGRSRRGDVSGRFGQPHMRWALVDIWLVGDFRIEVTYDAGDRVQRVSVERLDG